MTTLASPRRVASIVMVPVKGRTPAAFVSSAIERAMGGTGFRILLDGRFHLEGTSVGWGDGRQYPPLDYDELAFSVHVRRVLGVVAMAEPMVAVATQSLLQ